MAGTTGGGKSPPPLWSRAAVITGLVGLGVTQPVLDLLGRNPEFFIAGRYSVSQIVAFGVVVALLPGLVLAAVIVAAEWLHERAGRLVFTALLLALGALFGNVFARGVGLDGVLSAIAAALLGAVGVGLLIRVRPGRMLLEMLAGANVLFLIAFLLVSPTSKLLSGSVEGDLGRIRVPELPGPVVVIVFDELPLTTLLRGDGSINADRYPAFAELGERTTWYRNASTVHPHTERAVPALMTGRITRPGELPTHRDLPRNLLTLFGTSTTVNRYEAITDMCPPDVCRARPRQPLSQALEDAFTVYRHRVLPDVLRDHLPAIDTAWGGFGGLRAQEDAEPADEEEDDGYFPSGAGGLARWDALDPAEQSPGGQIQALLDAGLAIDGAAELHFIHVVLPHNPWNLTPFGTQMLGPLPSFVIDSADPAFDAAALLRYQRHSLQTGAADAALGEILDHMIEAGIWDDATVVVTADHGIGLLPPDFGREPTPANIEEVMRVPLFIKAPGQAEPSVVDAPALTIDVLPTIIDLLGIETDWEIEGHSLVDGSAATVEPAVSVELDPLFEVAGRHAARFPFGDGWMGLAAVGDHAELVGTRVSDHRAGGPSTLSWAPEHSDTFSALPTPTGFAPQVLTGLISGSGDERPPELVVSVNGTIGGVARIHSQMPEGWVFFAVLGPVLVDGANDIEAYQVESGPEGPILHPLQ